MKRKKWNWIFGSVLSLTCIASFIIIYQIRQYKRISNRVSQIPWQLKCKNDVVKIEFQKNDAHVIEYYLHLEKKKK